MSSDAEPAKLLLPFLQRADELQKHEPLVAYYCRLFAMERGLRIPQKERTKTTNSILVSLMNQLEKDKKSLKLGSEDNLYVEGFASNVFAKADKQDRAGRADLNTAKTFYAASIFFEVLNQFGELAPDIEQKLKYSIWKAADIRKALKEGRNPEPGPPGGDSDNFEPQVLRQTHMFQIQTKASKPIFPASHHLTKLSWIREGIALITLRPMLHLNHHIRIWEGARVPIMLEPMFHLSFYIWIIWGIVRASTILEPMFLLSLQIRLLLHMLIIHLLIPAMIILQPTIHSYLHRSLRTIRSHIRTNRRHSLKISPKKTRGPPTLTRASSLTQAFKKALFLLHQLTSLPTIKNRRQLHRSRPSSRRSNTVLLTPTETTQDHQFRLPLAINTTSTTSLPWRRLQRLTKRPGSPSAPWLSMMFQLRWISSDVPLNS
ncbi:hypothetical protein KSP39_PZI000044 [Platanthera zijinensis]|uniref:Vta1/callose synthase N-terminal domain-containing protein n=1 Tax=Platanthera zijinensis TaxID=2320716 RepID=A0AAP0C2E4_9ASPA